MDVAGTSWGRVSASTLPPEYLQVLLCSSLVISSPE